MNSAVVSIGMQVSVLHCVFRLLEYISKSEIIRSYGPLISSL